MATATATRDRVDIPALKARHPLAEVVEAAGVVLHGKGRVRQGVCPFHDEAEGSFTVYGDSQRFYCFGCGAGGDVLDFVRRMDQLSLPEAIRRLDQDGTVVRPVGGPVGSGQPASAGPPVRDPALLTAAARIYAGQLAVSREARDYLASRGIGADAARRLGLGYATGRGLREHLQAQGFDCDRQRYSGLFTEGGAERFGGMVVVPDTAFGLVRWMVGRAIAPDAKPRFQALPGPKPVLGLGRLGPVQSWVILTEGVFDYLTLAGWGYPAVAALGTQGLERVAESLKGCPRVFLAFDNDEAGKSAAQELKHFLGRRAAVVRLPEGMGDVADLASLPDGQKLFGWMLVRSARTVR